MANADKMVRVLVAIALVGLGVAAFKPELKADEMTTQEYAELMAFYEANFTTPIDTTLSGSMEELGIVTGGVYNNMWGDLTDAEYAELMQFYTLCDPLGPSGN